MKLAIIYGAPMALHTTYDHSSQNTPVLIMNHDVPAAKDFIKDQFLACNVSGKNIYPHFTTATDTNNVRMVFTVVLDKIVKQSFKSITVF